MRESKLAYSCLDRIGGYISGAVSGAKFSERPIPVCFAKLRVIDL